MRALLSTFENCRPSESVRSCTGPSVPLKMRTTARVGARRSGQGGGGDGGREERDVWHLLEVRRLFIVLAREKPKGQRATIVSFPIIGSPTIPYAWAADTPALSFVVDRSYQLEDNKLSRRNNSRSFGLSGIPRRLLCSPETTRFITRGWQTLGSVSGARIIVCRSYLPLRRTQRRRKGSRGMDLHVKCRRR